MRSPGSVAGRRLRIALCVAWLVAPRLAAAQPALAAQPPPAAETEDATRWSAAAELALYVLPDEENYLWPSLSADRGWLHLQARYNYEARDTASVWAGVNFEVGDQVTFALTPMVGVVWGDIDGIAPGFLATLSAWKLELYSEGEWMFDADNRADSFYYSWSELTFLATDWLHVGLAAQKTRAYQSARYIERGLLAGVSWRNASVTGYVFEPFSDDPTMVVSVGWEFR